jgi:hypothetical protein
MIRPLRAQRLLAMGICVAVGAGVPLAGHGRAAETLRAPTLVQCQAAPGLPGCANTLNLQSMVVSPADVQAGREPGPALAAPFAAAIERYLIDGEGRDGKDPANPSPSNQRR